MNHTHMCTGIVSSKETQQGAKRLMHPCQHRKSTFLHGEGIAGDPVRSWGNAEPDDQASVWIGARASACCTESGCDGGLGCGCDAFLWVKAIWT